MSFLKGYWPTMVCVGLILYATLTSDPIGVDELPAIPHIDKLIHAVMMGGLLSAVAFDWRRGAPERRLTPGVLLAMFVGVAVFAAADEWLQGMLEIGRPSDWADMAANIVGELVALVAAPPAINAVLGRK